MDVTPLIFTQKTPRRDGGRSHPAHEEAGAQGGSGPYSGAHGASVGNFSQTPGTEVDLFPFCLLHAPGWTGQVGRPRPSLRWNSTPRAPPPEKPTAPEPILALGGQSPGLPLRTPGVWLLTCPQPGSARSLPTPAPVTAQRPRRNERSLCLPPSAYFLCPVNMEK